MAEHSDAKLDSKVGKGIISIGTIGAILNGAADKYGWFAGKFDFLDQYFVPAMAAMIHVIGSYCWTAWRPRKAERRAATRELGRQRKEACRQLKNCQEPQRMSELKARIKQIDDALIDSA